MEEVYNIPYKLTNKKLHLKAFNKYASHMDYHLVHRIIYRYLSLPLISLFVKLGINPNYISVAGFFIRLVAFVCYLLFMRMPAVIVFQLGYLLDWCDGPVARATKRISKLGRRLDPTIDLLSWKLFFLAVPIGIYFHYKEPLVLLLALAFVTALTIREMIGIWINAWLNVEEKKDYFTKREDIKAKNLLVSKIAIMVIDFLRLFFPFIVFFNLTFIYYFYFLAILSEFLRILYELYSTFKGLRRM